MADLVEEGVFEIPEQIFQKIKPSPSALTSARGDRVSFNPEWKNVFRDYLGEQEKFCVLVGLGMDATVAKKRGNWAYGRMRCSIPGCPRQYIFYVKEEPDESVVRISFVQPLHKGDYCKSLYIASRAILFLLANGENTYNRGCNEILVKSIYGGFEKKIVPH